VTGVTNVIGSGVHALAGVPLFHGTGEKALRSLGTVQPS
jgi:hypothetical protein